MRWFTLSVVLLSCVLMAPGACENDAGGGADGSAGGADSTTPRLAGGEEAGARGGTVSTTKSQTFSWSVTEGVPDSSSVPAREVTAATPLGDAATRKILARLPAVAAKDGDTADFALRPSSRPPPRTGDTIEAPFPPPPGAGGPAIGTGETTPKTAKVLRFQPKGDVPIAPRLSVTFATPMVPITSHDTLAAKDVPVTLTPKLDGVWRWVGTQTLFFQPKGRAPMATHYTATVKPGLKDVNGQALDLGDGVSWKFSTPPLRLVSSLPSGSSVSTDPVIRMTFDQRIDPAALLPFIRVTADGKDVAISALSPEELAKRYEASNPDIEGRWIAFKPNEALPTDAAISVTVKAGAPSAEGPRKTTEALSQSFRTYGPFRFVEARCGWRDCRPMQGWVLEFTNLMDAQKFDPQGVTVSPAVPNLQVSVSGRFLNLRGITKGRTTYTIQVAKALTDTFGQTLDAPVEAQIKVDAARPILAAPDQGFVVLDPTAKKKRFTVYTINHEQLKVTLRKVGPADFDAYNKAANQRWNRKPPALPGQVVLDATIDTGGASDALTEVPIDLGPALAGDYGNVIIEVAPTKGEENARRNQTILAWVQVTDIGLDAFWDAENLVAWATELKGGEAISDLKITMVPGGAGQVGTTDQGGVAVLALPTAGSGRQMLVAKRDGDTAFLPDNFNSWSGGGQWRKQTLGDHVRWMIFDDRQLYRPGETVSVKGFVRSADMSGKGGVGLLSTGAIKTLRYKVIGPRGNDMHKGTVSVSATGGFDLSFKLPKTPNLGYARIQFSASLAGQYNNTTVSHSFRIEEFRRPEFEVSAQVSQGPHLVGGEATATVKASYFAGGPLPGAEVKWQWRSSAGSFSPPNNSGFVFGQWRPWWGFRGGASAFGGEGASYQSVDGKTSGSGEHTVALKFRSVDPPRAMSLSGEATVVDVNRQSWTARTALLVHPANHYVGIRTKRRFVERGEPIDVEAVVADLDGKRVEGSVIAIRVVRQSWKQIKGQWLQVDLDPQSCTVTSAADPVKCSFEAKAGGPHQITATIVDDKQRPNQSAMTVWVPGGEARPPTKKLEREVAELIPERQDYQPGETAKVLVQAPFDDATGLLTIRRGALVEHRSFTIKGRAHTLEIPVHEWMIPNFHVHVHLSGASPRVDKDGVALDVAPRPAYAHGNVTLRVPPTVRTLSVAAVPAAAKTEPGAKTAITVTVKDAKGQPVKGAELAVVVVDEAVLAMTGYRIPDPLSIFYQSRGDGVREQQIRQRLLLASLQELIAAVDEVPLVEPEEMAFEESAGSVSDAPSRAPRASMARTRSKKKSVDRESGPKPQAIAVRSNFNPLAIFAPDVTTDADGVATVKYTLPDNLTRYRVMVVAASGDNLFGSGESAVTARLPLMVRLSAPRFLNFGDRFELPITVQNQTDKPMNVELAVRVTNARLTDGAGRKVRVPANDRVEVRLPVTTEMAGTARIQAGAVSGKWADATEVALPVWTPSTTEAFATYGVVDGKGIVQQVQMPGEVVPQFGGLDITTSSTQLQALTDAVVYLSTYPFECSEQRSSRIMSIAALKDVLTAFEAPGLPSPKALVAAVAADLKALRNMQNNDGGFAWWRRGDESWPFLTVHVTHALARAQEKGFKVQPKMLQDATRYLENIRTHFPSHYGEETRRTIRAYAIYVLQRLGRKQSALTDKAMGLVDAFGGVKSMQLEAIGWLYPTLSASKAVNKGANKAVTAIRKHLNNQVRETAGAAHFTTRYSDGAHLLLHSSRRADGLLLEGLIGDQPKSDLIPKIVRGLLGHKTKGRWANTQESAWVLLGLDRYFNVFEKVTPDFISRAWLGDKFAGEHKFKGRTTERHNISVPMSWLADAAAAGATTQALTLSRTGKGRMYYRLGMRYAPASLKLEAADHGFAVQRTYEGVDDPKDVQRLKDGTWKIRAGARVRIKVTMATPDRRYHVALVDPLPAGLEAINPELLGGQTIAPPTPQGSKGKVAPRRGRRYWWWGPWYAHDNLRDERAEAFSSLLWDGVYTYTYLARATTPGRFVVPPPKAEEMYSPETFGRGASAIVVVE